MANRKTNNQGISMRNNVLLYTPTLAVSASDLKHMHYQIVPVYGDRVNQKSPNKFVRSGHGHSQGVSSEFANKLLNGNHRPPQNIFQRFMRNLLMRWQNAKQQYYKIQRQRHNRMILGRDLVFVAPVVAYKGHKAVNPDPRQMRPSYQNENDGPSASDWNQYEKFLQHPHMRENYRLSHSRYGRNIVNNIKLNADGIMPIKATKTMNKGVNTEHRFQTQNGSPNRVSSAVHSHGARALAPKSRIERDRERNLQSQQNGRSSKMPNQPNGAVNQQQMRSFYTGRIKPVIGRDHRLSAVIYPKERLDDTSYQRTIMYANNTANDYVDNRYLSRENQTSHGQMLNPNQTSDLLKANGINHLTNAYNLNNLHNLTWQAPLKDTFDRGRTVDMDRIQSSDDRFNPTLENLDEHNAVINHTPGMTKQPIRYEIHPIEKDTGYGLKPHLLSRARTNQPQKGRDDALQRSQHKRMSPIGSMLKGHRLSNKVRMMIARMFDPNESANEPGKMLDKALDPKNHTDSMNSLLHPGDKDASSNRGPENDNTDDDPMHSILHPKAIKIGNEAREAPERSVNKQAGDDNDGPNLSR